MHTTLQNAVPGAAAPCNVAAGGVSWASEENRHWIGSTLRYQYGDFSFLPSLMLYIADDDMLGDSESFVLDVRGSYTTGPLTLSGRIVYTPGSTFNSDGSVNSDRDYDVIGVWAIPGAVEGFALFGNAYGRDDLGPLPFGNTIQTNIRHDRFGLMHAAAMVNYTLTPQTSLAVNLGIFNSGRRYYRHSRHGCAPDPGRYLCRRVARCYRVRCDTDVSTLFQRQRFVLGGLRHDRRRSGPAGRLMARRTNPRMLWVAVPEWFTASNPTPAK